MFAKKINILIFEKNHIFSKNTLKENFTYSYRRNGRITECDSPKNTTLQNQKHPLRIKSINKV